MTARRHRPTYLLYLPGGPIATCGCHYGRRVTLDRPLGRTNQQRRVAA